MGVIMSDADFTPGREPRSVAASSYSCAAADKILTDLRRRAVPLR